MFRCWIAVALVACSGKVAPPPPAPVVVVSHGDAGVDGITVIIGFDPASGMHLDDDTPGHVVPRKPQTHAGHPIDITLRSTPSGAMAAVDGIQIGNTPTYWAGEANGREHEFTFVLDGHATARYRFVPITSGVIHGHLEAVAKDTSDTNAPPPEVVPAISAPPPPTTLVTPPARPSVQVDAAVAPSPVVAPVDATVIDVHVDAGESGLGPRP